jgi:hypothetical protein
MDNGQGTGMETPCQKDFQKTDAQVSDLEALSHF